MHIYADNAVFLVADPKAEEIQVKLNREKNSAAKWLTTNRLTIHLDKTKYMIFGSKQELQSINKMQIMISKEKLEQCEKFKYLDVWFDPHLNWNEHLKVLADKISMKIGKIKRSMPFLSKTTRKLIVNVIVVPHFDYCCEAWSSASNTSLKRPGRLYNKATKLASNEDRVSLQDRLDKNVAILTFKCLNDLAPLYLLGKLTLSVHPKNTRSCRYNKIYVERLKNRRTSLTFKARATQIWNKLPDEITSLRSKSHFKNWFCRLY